MVHIAVLWLLGLVGINVIIQYGGYIVGFGDIVVVSAFVFIGVMMASFVFYWEETNRGNTKHFENITSVMLFIRIMAVLGMSMIATFVWDVGIYHGDVFIFILVAWSYIIFLISLTAAELVFKHKRCPDIEEKGKG
jgi:hypothetical protein